MDTGIREKNTLYYEVNDNYLYLKRRIKMNINNIVKFGKTVLKVGLGVFCIVVLIPTTLLLAPFFGSTINK